MISEMHSLCHIACAPKTYQILSPLLFEQSLHFSLLIDRIFLFTCIIYHHNTVSVYAGARCLLP